MEYEIFYNFSNNFFTISTTGDLCVKSFSNLAEDLLYHRDWEPGTDCLFDFINTDFSKASRDELRLIALLHRQKEFLIGKGKSAFVMRDLCNFGMGRMYQGITEPTVSRIYGIFLHDLIGARSWLRPKHT